MPWQKVIKVYGIERVAISVSDALPFNEIDTDDVALLSEIRCTYILQITPFVLHSLDHYRCLSPLACCKIGIDFDMKYLPRQRHVFISVTAFH